MLFYEHPASEASQVHTKPLRGQNVVEGGGTFPRCCVLCELPSPKARNSLLPRLGPLKLCNLCARLNHFLGVSGKIGDCHLLHFSVLFIVVYSVFFCWCIFHGENHKTKSPFSPFSKKSKQVILFCNFLHEKCIDRKNRVHHDEEHGKTKKMAVSDFSVDPQKVV